MTQPNCDIAEKFFSLFKNNFWAAILGLRDSQLAPFSLQDVLQMMVFPPLQDLHTAAQFALPELQDLKFFSSRTFADEACTAAVWAARGCFDGVRNAMGVCK